jgi:hypothetical protein
MDPEGRTLLNLVEYIEITSAQRFRIFGWALTVLRRNFHGETVDQSRTGRMRTVNTITVEKLMGRDYGRLRRPV